MLFFQVLFSAEFLSSLLSLPAPVREALPCICTLQNEVYTQLLALMTRKAAKRNSYSPIASVEVAAVALK